MCRYVFEFAKTADSHFLLWRRLVTLGERRLDENSSVTTE